MTRLLIAVLFGTALLMYLGSYVGALHPLGDSLAVFRPWWGGAVLATAALMLRCWSSAMGLLCLLVSAGQVIVDRSEWAHVAETDFRLYQKNLSFRLQDMAKIRADLKQLTPHLATFQEVTATHRVALTGLSDLFPHQHHCPFAAVGGVAIASAFPIIDGSKRCADRDGVAAARVKTPTGSLWVVSIHLHWPYPYGQAAQVDRLRPLLEGLDGPVVIGGDFNMVKRSHALQNIARWTRTHRPGPVHNTLYIKGLLALSIDHVLIPSASDGRVTRRAKLGSDHHGLLVQFGARTN